MENKLDIDKNKNARIDRLSSRTPNNRSSTINSNYTNFVRIMRMVLPIAAILVITVLFLRPSTKETLVIETQNTNKQEIKNENIVQNELINPTFESKDKKNQPYKITATRAVQGEKNKDLIMLEQPVGIMTMKNGLKVTMRSKTGAYRQDTDRFFLQGNVFVTHENGYTLRSEEAHIDLKQNIAWSEKDVQGTGPEIKISAKGVKANGQTGEIIFTGPAKLILEKGLGGIK